jgi:hypothetical protein
MKDDAYCRYVRAYGKGTSGARITDIDYGRTYLRWFLVPFSAAGQVAVSLGVQDATACRPLRSRRELEEEVRRLIDP